jgi:hypothetical protein
MAGGVCTTFLELAQAVPERGEGWPTALPNGILLPPFSPTTVQAHGPQQATADEGQGCEGL